MFLGNGKKRIALAVDDALLMTTICRSPGAWSVVWTACLEILRPSRGAHCQSRDSCIRISPGGA